MPNTEVKGAIAEGSVGPAHARVGRRRPFFFYLVPRATVKAPGDIVPPLRGSIRYWSDTGGCACFACSPPAIYVSPHSGLGATSPGDIVSPHSGLGVPSPRTQMWHRRRKAPKGRHINSRGWSAQRARNPRDRRNIESNPEGVAQLLRRC